MRLVSGPQRKSRGRQVAPPVVTRLTQLIDRAAGLLKQLAAEGFQASLTVYGGEAYSGPYATPREVRVNVLWTRLDHDRINMLLHFAAEEEFSIEFSKEYGVTLRPC